MLIMIIVGYEQRFNYATNSQSIILNHNSNITRKLAKYTDELGNWSQLREIF